MKHRMSISVNEETVLKIMTSVREGKFRNKSHAIEYAINELLKQ